MGSGGMVVCPQPLAAEAGLAVLQGGGTAVDAAVATAFVQGVVDPLMGGLGGCGVMLVRLPDGREEVIDFYARAGSGVRDDQWERRFLRQASDRYGYVLEGWVNDVGHQSVGVPGTVAGLAEALRRHGSLGWAEVLQPALEQARRGCPVTGTVHEYWVRQAGPDEVPNRQRVQWTAEARRIYTRDGELWPVGETIPNPDLARTYRRLAEAGPDDFYRGEIAAAMAEDFAASGGSITAADLAGYRPHVGPALAGSYRGHRIATVPPPGGGLTLLQLLNHLEGTDLRALRWPSVEGARALVRAMAWAAGERERGVADPLFVPVEVDRLVAKEYAAAARTAHESPTTTQVCVVDGRGGAVSLTHTLGACSGVVTPGLGFFYNNYLNCFDPRPGRVNSLAPGKTRVTMMAPTMVFDRDGDGEEDDGTGPGPVAAAAGARAGGGGRLAVVAGAPGGTRIVTGILQALLNLLDHDMSPVEAVSAPRLDFQGEEVRAELRLPTPAVEGLRAAGHRVTRRPLAYDPYFAKVQLIQVAPDGSLRGASDPRGDGGVALAAGA
jgi:gamma-glutamyltranspeptidase/glutathione hydrolase